MVQQRLFAGLKFYFVPEPKIYRINRIKAHAAISHGATVVPQCADATHVLVAPVASEADMTPVWHNSKSGYAIVSNKWSSDCITRGILLDTAPYLEIRRDQQRSPSPRTDSHKEPQRLGFHSQSTRRITDTGISYPILDERASKSLPIPSEGHRKSDKMHTKNSNQIPLVPQEHIPVTRLHHEDQVVGQKRTAHHRGTPPHKIYRAHREEAMSSSPSNEHIKPGSSETPSKTFRDSRRGKIDVMAILDRPPSPKTSAQASGGPNKELISVFKDMMEARETDGKDFSSLAYKKALDTLRSLSYPVLSYEQALALPNFGKGTAELVQTILDGKLPEEIRQEMRQKSNTLALFETVYGVGPKTAREFWRKGFRTLADVRSHVQDERMLVSIDHHEDLIERISRTEVDQHFGHIKRLLVGIEPRAYCYCMGSFRRGQLDCGDIDIVLTREGASMDQIRDVMVKLLDVMYEQGIAVYTFGGGDSEVDSTRWLGATVVSPGGRWRRMDILCVPWQELGAAMIYYTGNDIFNRKIRYIAGLRGMQLNQSGLYRKSDNNKLELIEGHDERRIFEILGVPWYEPHERIF